MRRALLLLCVFALVGPATAGAAFPGANGKIAFSRATTGGTTDIFVANPDGSGAQNVTNSNGTDDLESAWSGDGSRLAFWSPPYVYTMDADGSNRLQLRWGGDPSLSPDGSQIAYSTTARFFPESNQEIFLMDADGSNVRNLTNEPLGPEWGHDYSAAWSPDGTQVAFARILGSATGIYVIDADGTGLTQVISGPGAHPDWAPDGTAMVFDAFGDIYLFDANGLLQVTSGPGDDKYPVFSPDGALIAFQRAREGSGNTYDIQVMNADGSGEHLAIANGREPAWQPVANRAPDCSPVRATPASLGAPNHRFLTVTISGATDPDGDAVDLEITGVTQDERVGAPDAIATSQPNRVRLRAERHPSGDGRVYRIAFEASDGRGGTCTSFATVGVRRGGGAPVDSAPPSYDSFGS